MMMITKNSLVIVPVKLLSIWNKNLDVHLQGPHCIQSLGELQML